MKQALDDLLRDPRAHGAEVDAAEVRRWSELALSEWRRDLLPTAPARPRVRWQGLGLFAGCAVAATALLPVLMTTLDAVTFALASSVVETPYAWAAGAAMLAFATVAPLRDYAARLISR